MGFETFTEGYRMALAGVEHQLKASLNRNNSARSHIDSVKVINDLIVYFHQERKNVIEVTVKEEDLKGQTFKDIDGVVDALLSQIVKANGVSTKGGMN